jgi:hypothetical protein
MSLLIGYPDHFGELLLGQAQHNAAFSDPPADTAVVAVDCPLFGFAMLFTRSSCLDQRIVDRSLSANSMRAG